MIVTVWWEDKQLGTSFGPDRLLKQCVADDLGWPLAEVEPYVTPVGLGGTGELRRSLREDLRRTMRSGPVCAVVDKDRVRDLWRENKPADCRSSLRDAIKREGDGDIYVVLLFENMESVLDAACRVLSRKRKAHKKPKPLERDEILRHLAYGGTVEQRAAVRAKVDGLDRLVKWTADHVRAAKAP